MQSRHRCLVLFLELLIAQLELGLGAKERIEIRRPGGFESIWEVDMLDAFAKDTDARVKIESVKLPTLVRVLRSSNKFCRNPAKQNQPREDCPVILFSVSDAREVVADHEKHDGHSHEGILFRAKLGLS